MALVASELVTNAVRHARTEIVVNVECREDSIYLEVRDGAEARPRIREASDEAPGGLGLPIVEALASSWGVSVGGGAGKAVWAEVRG